MVVDGLCDVKDIDDRFASVFQSVCVPNSEQRHQELETNFFRMYSQYVGNDFDVNEITPDYLHDCIGKLKKGIDPGFDDITSEHQDLYGSTSCCISHGPSQWEGAIFDPTQLGDPWTDFHET